MTPTLEELAEDTAVHLLPRQGFDQIDRGDYVFEAGPLRAAVHRIRLGDVAAAVAWTREECRRRGVETVEWWVGWHAEPAGLGERLLSLGLAPDEPPALTGMSCVLAPPAGRRRGRGPPDRDDRRAARRARDRLGRLAGVSRGAGEAPRGGARAVRSTAGRRRSTTRPTSTGGSSGSGAASSLDSGIALMGGAVLPEARGRGVYRTLVRARWEHAVKRGTPLLVVQAGPMSEPILTGLGFESHGELRLYVDRL